MKAEEWILALNDVNDKYITEAAEYEPARGYVKGSVKVWRAIAIAACVCLAASVALAMTAVNQTGFRRTTDSTVADDGKVDYYAEEMEEMPLYYSSDNAMSSVPAGASAVTYDTGSMYEAAQEEAFYEEDFAYDDYAMDVASESKIAGSGSALPAGGQARTGQTPKILYSVYMSMQTREYDNTLSQLEQAVAAYNGYFESQNLSNNPGIYRSAGFTIRIPAENLEDFLQQAGEIGTVTYMDKSAEDVSENYYDIQSRLDSARAKLERLQELLGEAEDMTDIIEIESAITDTQWEIDNYSGSLRYYDSRAQYSTVNIELNEVYEVVTEEAPMTFGDKIAQAFTQGVRGVGNFFRNVVIWLSASWIWLLLAAAVIVIAVVIIRKILRRRKD